MSDRIAAKLRGIAELPGIGRWLVHGSPVSAVLIEAADALEASERARAEAEEKFEAERFRSAALQDSIDNCAKRVLELARARAEAEQDNKALHEMAEAERQEWRNDLAKAEARSLALSTALRALVEQWRREAEQHKTHGDSYRRGQGWGLSDCATELEALLSSPVQEQYSENAITLRSITGALRALIEKLDQAEAGLLGANGYGKHDEARINYVYALIMEAKREAEALLRQASPSSVQSQEQP